MFPDHTIRLEDGRKPMLKRRHGAARTPSAATRCCTCSGHPARARPTSRLPSASRLSEPGAASIFFPFADIDVAGASRTRGHAA